MGRPEGVGMQLHDAAQQCIGRLGAPGGTAEAVEDGECLGLARRQFQYLTTEPLGLARHTLPLQLAGPLDHRQQRCPRPRRRQRRKVEPAAALRSQPAAAGAQGLVSEHRDLTSRSRSRRDLVCCPCPSLCRRKPGSMPVMDPGWSPPSGRPLPDPWAGTANSVDIANFSIGTLDFANAEHQGSEQENRRFGDDRAQRSREAALLQLLYQVEIRYHGALLQQRQWPMQYNATVAIA